MIALGERLCTAVEARDWNAVGVLDGDIQALLCEVDARYPEGVSPAPELLAARRRVGDIHAEAMRRCGLECARLRAVLAQHLAHADGWAAYRQLDGMIGE